MSEQLTLVDQVRLLVTTLDTHGIPYLIGGALALGFHVAQPRATQDIDIQVYPPEGLDDFLAALPEDIVVTDADRRLLNRDHQARLRWHQTPVDVFLPADEFHHQMRTRAVAVPFPGLARPLQIVGATDLTVLKALFDRPKDWVDIAEMIDAGSVQVDLAIEILSGFDAEAAVATLAALS